MNFVWSAVIALGVAGAAYADDDEARTTSRTYSQAEVEALLDLATRVGKLEEAQQDAETERLKKMAEKERQEDQASLPGRVSALEKKMGSGGQTWDASKMLSFSSADGNFTAKIGGRLYFVYRHNFDNDTTTAADSFIVDTARFQLDGTFYKEFFYRLEGEAKSGENAASTAPFRTKDIFLGYSGLSEYATIMAGQFKMTMSQEETTSSRFTDFGERSVLNRIVPGHITGVLVKGDVVEKIFEWNLGVCNGPVGRDGDKGTVDTNDEKDIFGRVFITPLKTIDAGMFKSIRIGFDGSRGKRDGPVGAPANVSSGDFGLPAILTYTAGGAVVRGYQTREDLNFSWLLGPASLRAEYLRVKSDLDGATAGAMLQKAWYVAATYLLTGEDKPLENRVKPKSNFSPLDGQWGAWELAARWAVIDTNNDSGITTAANQTHTTEYAFGINWWLIPNMAIRFDLEHYIYDRDVATGFNGALKRSEDSLYIRWQIDF